MKRAHQVTAVVCVAFAALVVRGSLTMKLYTPLGPGPGFFPFWLSLAFGGLASLMLIQATRESAPAPTELRATGAGYGRIVAIVGALGGAIVLMEPLGFRLTTLVFYLFLLGVLYIGNLLLVILNLPFIPLWVAVLKVPYALLYTVILGFCVLGAYSLNGSVFDVGVMTVFGVLGYLLRKLDIPAAPMVLTMVLGPLMERALRQSLDISGRDITIFVARPISAIALAVAFRFGAASLMQGVRSVKARDAQV